MKNDVLKGAAFIALGACCYGMLGTFVKMAYNNGYSTGEVTLSQFGLGFAALFVLTLFNRQQNTPIVKSSNIKSSVKLIAAGTSLGLTSIFYYQAVKYIPVSIGIVLLMQTVWMGVVVEMARYKQVPGALKIAAVIIILAGTVLSTNLLKQSVGINWKGFGWGIMAAVCYTATMYSSNHIELHFTPLKRSLYMILGGFIIIALIFHSAINSGFSGSIFLSWGLVVSLFGTILPPLLFTRGMPMTGMGLGAIIASIEVPVSVLMANLLLDERVSALQWVGVTLILFAVALMNMKKAPKLSSAAPPPNQSGTIGCG